MRKSIKMAAVAAALFTLPGVAGAQAVVSGFDTNTLINSDDNFEGPSALGFSANYFGSTFTQAYVATNGYITFGAGQTEYDPVGLGSGYSGNPIIAAFYGDVDTRRGGVTTYGTGSFGGRDAFGVTYNDVGYYISGGGGQTTNRNTFQILLVDRADTGMGNFDIMLNYDKIQWEAGTSNGGAAATGLGGSAASVGYNAGQPGNPSGTYFEFAGSRTNGALLDGGANSLSQNSNMGVNGRYLFNVRNGVVAPPPTNNAVPEPATWAMMIIGFGAIGGTMRRRRERMTVRFA